MTPYFKEQLGVVLGALQLRQPAICPDHQDGQHIFDAMGLCYGPTCGAREPRQPAVDRRASFEAWAANDGGNVTRRADDPLRYASATVQGRWRAYNAALDHVGCQPTAPVRMSDELRDFIEGMSVSVDVSTGEPDSSHRYMGTVTEVMDDPEDKHGVVLLVQDAKPNFAAPAAAVPEVAAFYGFMDEENCTVDLCFTPQAPRRDGVFATAYYTQASPTPPVQPAGREIDCGMFKILVTDEERAAPILARVLTATQPEGGRK
jgi:hypothetical protein